MIKSKNAKREKKGEEAQEKCVEANITPRMKSVCSYEQKERRTIDR